MAQKIDYCENCGKVLKQEEQAYVYEGQVVCPQCNNSLRHPTYVTQTKSVSGLGIAALVLGLIACLGCWIPMCGIISLPFAILGTLFGIIGIIIAKLKKKTYASLPIAGTIVSITAAAIVIIVTGSVMVEDAKDITKRLVETKTSLDEAQVKSTKPAIGGVENKNETLVSKEGNAVVKNINAEKQAYIDKVKIMNLRVVKNILDRWGVFGEIKNEGNRTLSEVEITIYYLDNQGKPIYEDTYHPVLASSWSSSVSKSLKPNYIEKFGYDTDEVPSEWSNKVKAYITNIEFEK